jgi:hypothetical protein
MEKATVAVKDGAIVAYMNSQYSTGTLHVTEFAAVPGEKRALLALLHEALRVADGAASVVVIPAALQQVLGSKLREMAGEPEKLEQNIMCRVVNTMALAEQMRPVWKDRLHSTDWHGSILVDVGIDAFTLDANANGLAVRNAEPSDTKVTFTHSEFLNLLYGNGDAQTDGNCSNEAARKAVAALFPPLAHTFWRADGF